MRDDTEGGQAAKTESRFDLSTGIDNVLVSLRTLTTSLTLV